MPISPVELEFIHGIIGAAQEAQRQAGIPASITMAQAVVESGWGKTSLAREGFNYFGVKAVQCQDYCEFPTKEFINGTAQIVQAKFARYVSPTASFQAHTLLLANNKRYKPAMACCSDPAAFAAQLQKCGYSTNPQYADLLMSLVREFNLAQYDAPPPPDPAVAKGVAA